MAKKISLGGELIGKINFAMNQNYVPVIRFLTLFNETEEDLRNITLKINFEPDFIKSYEQKIEVLNPRKPIEISPVKLIIKTDYLASLTEKIVGNIHFEIFQEEECLLEEDRAIELLAYDEWPGIFLMPEMLAAFITPNHPAVRGVLGKAGELLQKWKGNPSFTGYQTGNPNIVKLQMAAIYGALQGYNIAYHMPPASYEIGQRVRLPHTVLAEKAGTCLDLSVLYASCLEAAGLNPIISIIKGHAFTGVWLEETTFPECAEEDVSALTKRLAKGIEEVCFVECTDYVAGEAIQFDKAEKHGADHFLDPQNFLMAIDVHRTRGSGVRPIPVRILEDGKMQMVDYGARKESEFTDVPQEIDLENRGKIADASKEATKQQVWERKLLDLSLRNSLINFRPNKTSIQIMTANLGQLEDALSDGEDFAVLERPGDFTHSLRDTKIFEIENAKDLIETIAENEFKSRRIRTFLTQTEAEKALKQLYRQAQLSMEENGSNTLYLALGFLRWFQKGMDIPRYAPIVLIPITLERKIQKKSYLIRVRDEETQMNITLLEMLRQNYNIDISSLDPLPTDEHGVDLALVFRTIRHAVMEEVGWDIEEFAFIGLFSFSQFIMWNDIHSRADELSKNKVVASLMSGKMEWEPVRDRMEAKDLDMKTAPSDLAVPASADSSQLEAIHAAAAGESFVLHGAPGTGKSQTITNMIANTLYQGKSVLFVAEKMAALTVVQKRLENLGLDPFCLELHSNKAQKKTILGQLEKTLNYGKVQKPADYERAAGELHKLRTQLNSAVSELHRVRPCGMSIYEAICKYESLEQYKNRIRFSSDVCGRIGEHTLEEWRDALNKLLIASRDCGGFKSCEKFYLLRNPEISMDEIDNLFSDLREYIETLKQMDQCVGEAADKYGMERPNTYEEYEGYYRLFYVSRPYKNLSEPLLGDSITSTQYDAISNAIELGKAKALLDNKINDTYEYGIKDYNASAELLEWKRSETLWAFSKIGLQKKLLNKLNLYKKGNPYTREEFAAALSELIKREELNDRIQEASADIQDLLGGFWNNERTDWDKVAKVCEESSAFRSALREVGLSDAQKEIYKHQYCVRLLIQDYEHTADYLMKEECIKLFRTLFELRKRLIGQHRFMVNQLEGEPDYIQRLEELFHEWKLEEYNIRPWSNLLKQMERLSFLGAQEAVDAWCSGAVAEDDLKNAVECSISYALARDGISKSKVLSSFYGTMYEADIEKYSDLVKRFEDLTKRELRARLSARIPNAYSIGEKSAELNTLQKAIKNGGRMMSLRKLFDTIPELLRQMCPCMLMSPMSVAQYIDPTFPKFDLVIFDEASQMPTCEAVGAIARGENVVVVGDPKQLPPTSFFTGNKIDEENYDKEDLESVLDDCLALSMPEKHLLWHYRSRHESLIAYSNSRYYDNKLYTFPSPEDLVSEVKWVPVEGFYDKGGTRQNRAEAEAVVSEVVRRLSDEELRNDSIGVVTFSSVQQILIDDLLVEAFQKHPELEQFNKAAAEPVLIKNLENVQGDERDIILFSIGYGPDQEGRISMNFGPLNNAGGWRRLNVAITRARKEMVVFSTLRPEQIDLKKTRSDGVAGLKGFLEFAAKGRNSLAAKYDQLRPSDYEVEDHITDALEKLGYQVRKRIGSSEFKVDIGVVNPLDSERYLLGILCDGKNYEAADTSRDRNILQPGMLKNLGWRLYRVWTIDWMTNQNGILDRIVREIQAAEEEYTMALQAARAAEAAEADEAAEEQTEKQTEKQTEEPKKEPADELKKAPEDEPMETQAEEPTEKPVEDKKEPVSVHGQEHPVNQQPKIPETMKSILLNQDDENMVLEPEVLAFEISSRQKIAAIAVSEPGKQDAEAERGTEDGEAADAADTTDTADADKVIKKKYVSAELGVLGNIDTFYDASRFALIKDCMEQIAEAEGPVSRKILVKRLLSAFGISRVGSKMEPQIEEYFKRVKLKYTRSEGIKYYWGRNQDPENYFIYRVPENPDARRSIEDISTRELANAAAGVLSQKSACNLNDLLKEMLKEFGYTRVTDALIEEGKRGVRYAEKTGKIMKENKIYHLPEKISG